MAERLRKLHQEDVRAKIKTSQLVNRLSDHALGELELTATQIKAIEVLIRKTLPDLSAVEMDHSGEVTTTHDLSAYSPAELDTLERLIGKTANASGDTTGESPAQPDRLH